MSFPVVALSACGLPAPGTPRDVSFDTAVAWIHQAGDSTRILVELATSQVQQEVGLSGRSSLDPESGMLFRFAELRSGDDAFWMWRTQTPLDVAFIDEGGVIRRILEMEPCALPIRDACPQYAPGVPYASALEVNGGWFAATGIGVGADVSVGPPSR